MRRYLAIALSGLGIAGAAQGGEIIFVDPAREKAQAIRPAPRAGEPQEAYRERLLEDARARAGRGEGPLVEEPQGAASEQARRARAYLDEAPAAPPAIVIQSGPPPASAEKARQAARSWSAPQPASSGNRCRTENTVGGIEGSAQGHTVIQSNTSGVTAVCK